MQQFTMLGAKEWQRDERGRSRRGVELAQYFNANMSVCNQIESAKRGAIVKDHVSEESPIDGTVVAQYGVTERVAQCEIRGQAGLRDVVSDFVRIDHRPAERNEVFARGSFAGTNAARNDNSFHLTTVATACDIAFTDAR
jgi:hypothetical protein